MANFGQKLRRLRTDAGLSLRGLGARSGIDFGYIGQIERGERRCTSDFAEILDQALDANGELIKEYEKVAMRRRTVLGGAVALPLIAADALEAVPAISAEALRHDLAATLSGSVADWDEIVWQYARVYADTPPRLLLDDLHADLMLAGMQLRKTTDDGTKQSLQRAIGLLSAFMAQTLGNLGDRRGGCRWWRTARQYADASRDSRAQVWVRGREVVRGLYEHRPLHSLIALADEASAITPHPGVGTGEVLAGRAQALALLGRTGEAQKAMVAVHDATEQMPDHVVADTSSMLGWPEYRLRHTESFVYTNLGDFSRADTAHDQALQLYPAHMARERVQVELHRSLRMVRRGAAAEGSEHARSLIEELPDEQRIEAILELGRSVIAAIPVGERHYAPVAELREMLALPQRPLAASR